MLVWEAGWRRGEASGEGVGQAEQSHITVEGVGVEMRMDKDLLYLDQLLTGIRPPLVKVSWKGMGPQGSCHVTGKKKLQQNVSRSLILYVIIGSPMVT